MSLLSLRNLALVAVGAVSLGACATLDPYGYGGGYGYGDCYWLRRQAAITGSAYWWRRYQECIGYY